MWRFVCLFVYTGMDHARALIQEECKHLLVSLLSIVSPGQGDLQILRMELEARLPTVAYPSGNAGPRKPHYRLTTDGGPYQVSLPINHVYSTCLH